MLALGLNAHNREALLAAAALWGTAFGATATSARVSRIAGRY
jgi:hypothetical protein